MSELAREEIKEAALAVGWNPEYREADETLAWFGPGQRFNDKCADAWPADALALLEAWQGGRADLGYAIHRGPDRDGNIVSVVSLTRWISGVLIPQTLARDVSPDLPTAAVRAVLQATQTGEEKT